MTDCNINGLQSTHTNSAFGEVGVGINEDLKLAEYADQQVYKVLVVSITNPQRTVTMVTPSLIVKSFYNFLFISPIRGTTSNNLSF